MKNIDLFSTLKLKNVVLPNRLFLAPMAGYTDVGFRAVANRCGAGLVVTEMVSVKALEHDSKKTIDLMQMTDDCHPIAVQLFGSDVSAFEKAVKLDIMKKFDIIDINMGCPVEKIVKNKEGCALMKNPELAFDIIQTCVKNTDKPVSVKFRIGYDENNINAVEFAKICERAGASMIVVHGRTRSQMYSGKANYEEIAKVVKAVKIPVIANGDICSVEDAQSVAKLTGCAGAMIGRGAVGNPSVFGKVITKKHALLTHIGLMRKYHNDKWCLLNIRKHLPHYFMGTKRANEICKELILINNMDELVYAIQNVSFD